MVLIHLYVIGVSTNLQVEEWSHTEGLERSSQWHGDDPRIIAHPCTPPSLEYHLLDISSYESKVIGRILLLKSLMCNLVKSFHLQHMRWGEQFDSNLILESNFKTVFKIKYSQALAFYTILFSKNLEMKRWSVEDLRGFLLRKKSCFHCNYY